MKGKADGGHEPQVHDIAIENLATLRMTTENLSERKNMTHCPDNYSGNEFIVVEWVKLIIRQTCQQSIYVCAAGSKALK